MIRRLGFEEEAAPFQAETQKARFWTEAWVQANLYCPACGADKLIKSPNNSPVRDFVCFSCREEFELKSVRGRVPVKVVDGAYKTMVERLSGNSNPSLALLSYDRSALAVRDLEVVPKQFFTPDVIEERKPLKPSAQKAGWVGCNILLQRIPSIGRISIVRHGSVLPRENVLSAWARTTFLHEIGYDRRGWLIDVWACVVALRKTEFELAEVYAHEALLQEKHPHNLNVRAKIRQQLQVLRDVGEIRFLGGGRYRLSAT